MRAPARSDARRPFLTLPTSCAALQSDRQRRLAGATGGTREHEPHAQLVGDTAPTTSPSTLHGCPGLAVRTEPHDRSPNEHCGEHPDRFERRTWKCPSPGCSKRRRPGGGRRRETTVRLPEGMQLNPSAANGAEACTDREVDFLSRLRRPVRRTRKKNSRPAHETSRSAPGRLSGSREGRDGAHQDAAAPHELKGLAVPAPNAEHENPFGSLLALYIVAEDPPSGVLVKLAGEAGQRSHRPDHHDVHEHPAAAVSKN